MDIKIERKNSKLLNLSLGAAGLILLVVILYFAFKSVSTSAILVSASDVSIAKVQYTDFEQYISLDGVVSPQKVYKIDAIEGGVVSAKITDGGTRVRKGDTILMLKNNLLMRDFINHETQAGILINNLENTRMSIQQQQFQKQLELIDINYQIQQAAENFRIDENLFNKKAIPQKDYLDSKREYDRLKSIKKVRLKAFAFDSLNAQLQISKTKQLLSQTTANLELIKENMEQLVVRAPESGLMSSVNVEVGEAIQSGQNIAQIDDLDALSLRTEISDKYLSRIQIGMDAVVNYLGEDYTLKVSKIYSEVSDGVFEIDLDFEGNKPDGLRRGQNLAVTLKLGQSSKSITIPVGSFFSQTKGRWIFVLNEQGDQAEKREIKIGRKNPTQYEILEGLEVGEEVIVSTYKNYLNKEIIKIN